ncbi:hypothetical protein ABT234_13350 [Streptomyces sp. NPDC001586]
MGRGKQQQRPAIGTPERILVVPDGGRAVPDGGRAGRVREGVAR